MTDLDRALYCQKVKEAGENPVMVTGLTKEVVSMLGSYFKLDDVVFDYIKDHPVKFQVSAVYSIYRIQQQKGAKSALKCAKVFIEQDKTQHWLRGRVKGEEVDGDAQNGGGSASSNQSNPALGYKKTGDKYSVKVQVAPDLHDKFEAELKALLDKYAHSGA